MARAPCNYGGSSLRAPFIKWPQNRIGSWALNKQQLRDVLLFSLYFDGKREGILEKEDCFITPVGYLLRSGGLSFRGLFFISSFLRRVLQFYLPLYDGGLKLLEG